MSTTTGLQATTPQQGGAAGPRVTSSTTGIWVSRVNLFPHRELVGPDQAARDETALTTLVLESRRRQDLAKAAERALTVLIDTDRDRASRDWLPLRRAVQSGRRPKDRHLLDPQLRVQDDVTAWVDSWQRTDQVLADLEGEHERALDAEREAVSEWARDPQVQRSTVMTSRSLHRAVDSRAGAGDALTKRQRKSEQSLVTYFGRSATKVSPFSRYTGTAFHRPDSPAGELGTEHTSTVALRRLLVRRAARRLATDPVDRLDLDWHVSGAVRQDEDSLVVHRREYVTTPQAKSDVVAEDDLRIPLAGPWGAVWPVLRRTAAGGAAHRELVEALTEAFGWHEDRAAEVVEALVRVQVLVPHFPAREQDADFLDQWLVYLEPFTGATSTALREALHVALQGERDLPAASPTDRATLIERTESAWSAAVDDQVAHPFVEDCYVTTGAPVPGPQVMAWSEQVRELAPLLVVMDDQRMLAAALESTFVRHYGRAGVCRDLRSFARQSYATFPLTQQLLGGEVPEDIRHIVGPLRTARRMLADHLVELGRSGAGAGTEVVHLDLEVVERAADLVPEREWQLPRSVTVFGQPADGELAVNHLYGGRARYFSRFLAAQPPEVVAELRQVVRDSGPDGVRQLHLRPALGFNANLNPLLTDEELRLTDEPSATPARLSIDELALVHRPGAGLQLLVAATGEPVEVLYTGFLVPHALPSEDMLLAMISGAPYFSFNELTLDLHARLAGLGRGAAASSPRIQHRDLTLFRRRWGMRTEDLATDAALAPHERHRELGLARLRAGLPAQVFARPLFGRQITPVERAMSARPQLVDLGSRLHTAGLQRRLEPLGETLLLEEFHPYPSAHGIASPSGRHASEVFFEIALSPGGCS